MATYKQMNVIRHHDVSTDGNSVISRGFSKLYEAAVDSFVRQKLPPTTCVERNEVQWRIVLLKRLQSWGTIGH